MGCDIHAHLEVKDHGDWERVAELYLCRSYALFAALAGVRNSGGVIPICPPKGMPDDASDDTCQAHDEDFDGFSYSWLLLEELQGRDWTGLVFFRKCIEAMACLGEPQDVRLVFWFDN